MRRLNPDVVYDKKGSTAAEFAMVLPLLLLLIFGLIDACRFIWTYNEAEKAAQMGARYAVATEFIPTKLYSYSFVEDGGMTQGASTAGSFSGVTCYYSGSVKCDSSDAWVGANNAANINSSAFDNIYNRMKDFVPGLSKDKVEVKYAPAGLGYAGDPGGSDVSPLVTVTIKGLVFTPITSMLFARITMGNVTSSLTMEDGSGSFSN